MAKNTELGYSAWMSSLSVIIITRNEEQRIRQCLESVTWADEIIVVDSGSSDNTVAICREYTDKVYETDWPGYGPQKNRALSYATKDWVLSLDADEWCSDTLQQQIQQAIQTQQYAGYQLKIRTNYCGHYIKYGDWGRDYALRLFQRNKGKFTDVPVHEAVEVNGPTAKLKGVIFHDSYADLHQVVEKFNHYTSLYAERKSQTGKRSSILKAIGHAAWMFVRSYFLKLGFLDGKYGFMLAVSSAESCYYKYAKLALRQ